MNVVAILFEMIDALQVNLLLPVWVQGRIPQEGQVGRGPPKYLQGHSHWLA